MAEDGYASTADVVKEVAAKLKVPRRAARAIVDEFLEVVARRLEDGEGVSLRRFGTFYIAEQRAGNEEYFRQRGKIPPGTGPLGIRMGKFSFSKGLRRRIGGLVRLGFQADHKMEEPT